MKLFLLLSFLPVDSLPPTEVLYASIDSFYQLQMEADLAEFQISKKGEWLKYLPSLGVTYTLDGQPRPALNLSSSILYRAKKDKQLRQAKQASIRSKYLLEAAKRKAVVDELIHKYYGKLEELQLKEEIHTIDQQLFAIEEDRYRRLEMAPSGYLKAKRELLKKEEGLNAIRQGIRTLKREVLAICFYAL